MKLGKIVVGNRGGLKFGVCLGGAGWTKVAVGFVGSGGAKSSDVGAGGETLRGGGELRPETGTGPRLLGDEMREGKRRKNPRTDT